MNFENLKLEIDRTVNKGRRYFVFSNDSVFGRYDFVTDSKYELKIWLDLNGLRIWKMVSTFYQNSFPSYKIFSLKQNA